MHAVRTMRVGWLAVLTASCAVGTGGLPSDGASTDTSPRAEAPITTTRDRGPRVVVLGPSGWPVPRASVSVLGHPFAEAATGEDGVAKLPELGGTGPLRLRVTPPSSDVALSSREVDWIPCAETTIRLEERQARLAVTGTIVDAEGRPVPEADYWVFDRPAFWLSRGKADEQGRFEVDDVPAGGVVLAAGDFSCHQDSLPGWPSLDDPEAARRLAVHIPAGTRDARVQLAAEQ